MFEAQPEHVQAALRDGAAAYSDADIGELPQHNAAALMSMVEGGATISTLPDCVRSAWAAALPNVPAQWAVNAERRGLPDSAFLSATTEALREAGVDLPRDWDLE